MEIVPPPPFKNSTTSCSQAGVLNALCERAAVQQIERPEAWRAPLLGHTRDGAQLPAIAALGKFDALHRGHRALAVRAAAMGGQPWLITFSGMADVLGTSSYALAYRTHRPQSTV